jgi:hypothetical protein
MVAPLVDEQTVLATGQYLVLAERTFMHEE